MQSKLKYEIWWIAVTDNWDETLKSYVIYKESVWWNMMLWDKIHQKKISINLMMIQIKQIQKFQNNQLSIWFYLKTIFEVFFNNLYEIFEILENDSWLTHLIFQNYMSKKIIKLEKLFKKSNIFADVKVNLMKETSFLLQTAMIMCTTKIK